MKKVVIFDMDGTLVDSSLTIVNAINHVRAKLNLEPLETNLILEKVNDPHLDPAKYFYEVPAFTPKHEAWFSNYYTQNHEHELNLYKGISELLEKLKKKGFKLAIATNSYRNSTIESLSYLKILDYFDSLACYDDVGRGKPAPDMLEKNLKDLDITPQEAIFIGDSERDLLASKSANIDYVMINWGFSDYKDAIHKVSDLEKAILKA
ncbi:Predicted phosphatase [hydrothermal vent metagenome]|uniref:Predicted phosphatase n=1 Tax=hydrothermal vent metagenome TaxID=652676 RepID=A0A1W1CZE3_9ZZZZ